MQESSRKTSTSALLTMPKPLTVWITMKSYLAIKRYEVLIHARWMNLELSDVQAGFKKKEEPAIKLPTSVGSSRKQEFQKNIYSCFIDYAKAFDCVDHNKLWKILQEMGIPDHLTCLLRNLYTGQEATVRTGHGTAD